MRSHASPRTPGLRHLCEGLGVRPFAETEGDARRLLDCEIAGRKRIGVAEAEQKINVGGPWSDSMQGGERCMGLIGLHGPDRGQIDTAPGDCFAELANRFDLWSRQTEPLEFVGTSQSHRVVVKWIESGK